MHPEPGHQCALSPTIKQKDTLDCLFRKYSSTKHYWYWIKPDNFKIISKQLFNIKGTKASYLSRILFSHLVMSNSLPSHVRAHHAPLSLGFSRQEYRNGLAFPTPGDLPNPGIKHVSHVLAGKFFTTEPPGKPLYFVF